MTLEALALAQTYWKRTDPSENIAVYVAVGGVLLVLVLYNVIRYGASSSSSHRFSRGAFRRAARAAGLSEEDIRFLEQYGKALDITDPGFVFRNPQKMDAFFKSVYRYIDKDSESEEDADGKRARLFKARENLTRSIAAGTKVTSSRQLGRGTPLTFLAPGEESYPTIIQGVEPAGIAGESVRDAYGEPLRFHKGSKLTCYFYSETHQGYKFTSRFLGVQRLGTKEIMIFAHSDAVTALPARSHARRETRVPCTFYRVAVSERVVKGKKMRDAKVSGVSFPGTIVDISAGGLGIQSANALPAGEFIKVEFATEGGPQSAFAKVVRMNKLKTIGGIMHAQFIRISQRSLNAILTFVYGYGE